VTLILIAFGIGLVGGIVGTTFAAKRGWIQPSKVDGL
jgi:hypothetical protein